MTRVMTNLSIVIPSLNRRDSVVRLVIALLEQLPCEASDEMEIVVVLDGSTDGSAEALAGIAIPIGARLIVREQPNKGPAAARNAGIAAASGEIVLFLDDDVIPRPGLVQGHLAAYADSRVDAAVGRIESVAASWCPPTVATLMNNLFDDQHARLSEEEAGVTALDVFTGNLSVRRRVLRAVGGFDESLTGLGTEDTDLGYRLLAAGANLVYRADAAVEHWCDFTSAGWRRRVWQEGCADGRLSRIRPAITPILMIDSLHEGKIGRRLAAQFAIQFPRLARAVSAIPFAVMPLAARFDEGIAALPLTYLSHDLAYWSGVRTALGSARAVRAGRSHSVPILAYHRVCDQPEPALAQYAVTPAALSRQVRLLARLGFRCMILRELIDAFEGGVPIGKRTVVLTFDDGYLDTVQVAAPILATYGYRATLFAVTSAIGGTAGWDNGVGHSPAPLAAWEDLRALREAGWEIGFHTATHPDLTTIAPEQLAAEVVEGWSAFARALGSPVETFAYPYGRHSPEAVAAVRRAGARAAVAATSAPPRGMLATRRWPRHALPRRVVLRSDGSLDVLLYALIGYRVPDRLRAAISLPRSVVGLVKRGVRGTTVTNPNRRESVTGAPTPR